MANKRTQTKQLDAHGTACAVLTPLIYRNMRELESGELLEVHTDDAAAREGVPAWTRMTGNTLVEAHPIDETHTTFIIRKK
jgi:tRNA 2-thiouridine synthesizing protein A